MSLRDLRKTTGVHILNVVNVLRLFFQYVISEILATREHSTCTALVFQYVISEILAHVSPERRFKIVFRTDYK